LSAVVLTLALSTTSLGVCAGWLPTPEARMACCAEGGGCPMHKADPDKPAAPRVLTQAEADSCCASSEHDDSRQASPMSALIISPAVLGAGLLLPPSLPTRVASDAWRIDAPVPTRLIPKHVLLSVFLV
jgi:hypothetical protein